MKKKKLYELLEIEKKKTKGILRLWDEFSTTASSEKRSMTGLINTLRAKVSSYEARIAEQEDLYESRIVSLEEENKELRKKAPEVIEESEDRTRRSIWDSLKLPESWGPRG